MASRRDFLKIGSLFVAAAAAPTVAYSFLRARQENWLDRFAEDWSQPARRAGESDETLKTRLRQVFQVPTHRKVIIGGDVYDVYEMGPISDLPVKVVVW